MASSELVIQVPSDDAVRFCARATAQHPSPAPCLHSQRSAEQPPAIPLSPTSHKHLIPACPSRQTQLPPPLFHIAHPCTLRTPPPSPPNPSTPNSTRTYWGKPHSATHSATSTGDSRDGNRTTPVTAAAASSRPFPPPTLPQTELPLLIPPAVASHGGHSHGDSGGGGGGGGGAVHGHGGAPPAAGVVATTGAPRGRAPSSGVRSVATAGGSNGSGGGNSGHNASRPSRASRAAGVFGDRGDSGGGGRVAARGDPPSEGMARPPPHPLLARWAGLIWACPHSACARRRTRPHARRSRWSVGHVGRARSPWGRRLSSSPRRLGGARWWMGGSNRLTVAGQQRLWNGLVPVL